MRPSSPTRRRLHAIDAGQLSLPFSPEADISAAADSVGQVNRGEVENKANLSTRRSRVKTVSKALSAIEKASPSVRNSSNKTANRKPPEKADISPDAKLLVSRREAAGIVSLSLRSIDGLLANKQLPFRKIGNRTLIPLAALRSFARMDHPERIAS